MAKRNKHKTTLDTLIDFTDNPCVFDLDMEAHKLIYTKEFYYQMNILLEQGKSAREAYDALGFDSSRLGVDRANACARRAREMAAERKGREPLPSDFDGSIPVAEMTGLSAEEMRAYAIAREQYLQDVIELQKKIDAMLEEEPFLLNLPQKSNQ